MVERSPSHKTHAYDKRIQRVKSHDSAEYRTSSVVAKKFSSPTTPPHYNAPSEEKLGEEQSEQNVRAVRIEKILHVVNYAISRQAERIDAVDNACNEFDHFDKAKHDEELRRLRADEILFQKLTFVVMMTGGGGLLDHNAATSTMVKFDQRQEEEIALICCALEMVYRASRHAVQESMNKIGMDMVPVLSQLLNQKAMTLAKIQVSNKNIRGREESRDEFCIDSRSGNKLGPNENVTRAIVASTVKILRSFARAGSETQRRCLLNQKDLLSTVFGIIMLRKYDKNTKRNGDTEIAADALSIIAFLAEKNNDDESNTHIILTLVDTKGLINVILWAAANDKDSRVRSQAAFATMNLIKVPRCHLSENRQTQLLDTLLALFDDAEDEPRKYAGAALFNLACSQEYNFLLASHQNGAFFDALVRVLRKDPNLKSRSNAAWVVFYIFSGQATVAQLVGNNCDLLDALADGVCHDDSLVKVPAAKALRKLAELVTSNMLCHDALLAALVKAAEGAYGSC